MEKNGPRLLLVDDHRILTDALEAILRTNFEIAGSFTSGREALNMLAQFSPENLPEAVVLDISMPDLNGIETARRIKKSYPNIAIVFLTMHPDRPYVEEAFRAGASGYVLKRDACKSLVEAIRAGIRGEMYLSKSVPEDYLRPVNGSVFELTSRQREVLELVSEGKTAKEIASLLGISAKTVEFHKASIMDKLALRTTAELTRYAIEHGDRAIPS